MSIHGSAFDSKNIKDILTSETIVKTQEMILKIKKTDYLGDSKWEFRHRKEPINASILDDKWIVRFRNIEITLKPGDSIRAKVNIEVKYDYDGEVSSINYNILDVLDILYSKTSNQSELFE